MWCFRYVIFGVWSEVYYHRFSIWLIAKHVFCSVSRFFSVLIGFSYDFQQITMVSNFPSTFIFLWSPFFFMSSVAPSSMRDLIWKHILLRVCFGDYNICIYIYFDDSYMQNLICLLFLVRLDMHLVIMLYTSCWYWHSYLQYFVCLSMDCACFHCCISRHIITIKRYMYYII